MVSLRPYLLSGTNADHVLLQPRFSELLKETAIENFGAL